LDVLPSQAFLQNFGDFDAELGHELSSYELNKNTERYNDGRNILFFAINDHFIGPEIAVRNLRKESTPQEKILKPAVIDETNFGLYQTPVEQRTCPTLQSLAAS
jgi:hypothetical protein